MIDNESYNAGLAELLEQKGIWESNKATAELELQKLDLRLVELRKVKLAHEFVPATVEPGQSAFARRD